MEEKPKKEEHVKLYIFLTILFFIILMFVGMYIKDRHDRQNPVTEEAKASAQRPEDPSIQAARAIYRLAGLVAVFLIIIVIFYKVTVKQK